VGDRRYAVEVPLPVPPGLPVDPLHRRGAVPLRRHVEDGDDIQLQRAHELGNVAEVARDDLVAAAFPVGDGLPHLRLHERRTTEDIFVDVAVDGVLAPGHPVRLAVREGRHHPLAWQHRSTV
jgi:hypothetical protein